MARNGMLLIVGLLLGWGGVNAQYNPDKVLDSNIHTVLVYPMNNPLGMPIITLNENAPLLISFDDFNARYQDYYYEVELMNADWTPVAMNTFDYLQGFNQNKIADYTVSSVAAQRYYHYQFSFPNANCAPKLSGNYILKVYKNGNPNEVLFTHRMYVVSNELALKATIVQPFDGNISKTHQKIQVAADVKNIPFFQPNELKIQVIQNFQYDGAQVTDAPNFIRGTNLEYNKEGQFIFPAGKEARWLDLRSIRFLSDRIAKIDSKEALSIVYVKPDISRTNQAYYTFNDLNGNFTISNTESLQSEYQNDYAKVVFTYIPEGKIPFVGQNLYLQGALTNNCLDKNALMQFDAKLGIYQKTLLLKQGYYSYNYVLRDPANQNIANHSDDLPPCMDDYTETEGNHWETENNYCVFAYYRAPGARQDQIIGFVIVNSKQVW
jgi:hypothetical protein